MNFTMAGGLARAVNLEVAHDNMANAVELEINKGVRDEHANGVEHVGVALAVSDDQEIFFAHAGARQKVKILFERGVIGRGVESKCQPARGSKRKLFTYGRCANDLDFRFF